MLPAAIAAVQPKLLNFASTTLPSSIRRLILRTSPVAGSPTWAVAGLPSISPTLRGCR